MPPSDADRLLDHLADQGGSVRASANLDPQWNAATAEAKHRQDLLYRLREAADLDGDRETVADLVDALAERGQLALRVTPESASIALTTDGTNSLEREDT